MNPTGRNKPKEPEINTLRCLPMDVYNSGRQVMQLAPGSSARMDPETITRQYQSLQYYNYLQYIQQMKMATGSSCQDSLGFGFDFPMPATPLYGLDGLSSGSVVTIEGLPPGRPKEMPKVNLSESGITYGEYRRLKNPEWAPDPPASSSNSYRQSSIGFDPRDKSGSFKNVSAKVDDGWDDDPAPVAKKSGLQASSNDWDDDEPTPMLQKPTKKPTNDDGWDDDDDKPTSSGFQGKRSVNNYSREGSQGSRGSRSFSRDRSSTFQTESSDRQRVRPGDWSCSKCQHNNFASRSECQRCNEPKGDIAGGGESSSCSRGRQQRDGDWNCGSCQTSNFATRFGCYRCKEPKGGSAGGSAGSGTRTSAGGEEATETLLVESTKVGRIIGKGGSMIKFLQADYFVKININKEDDDNGNRTVEIIGPSEDVKAVIEVVKQKVAISFSGPPRGDRGSGGGGGRNNSYSSRSSDFKARSATVGSGWSDEEDDKKPKVGKKAPAGNDDDDWVNDKPQVTAAAKRKPATDDWDDFATLPAPPKKAKNTKVDDDEWDTAVAAMKPVAKSKPDDDDWLFDDPPVPKPTPAAKKQDDDDWNVDAPAATKVKPADDDGWNFEAPPVDQPKKDLSVTLSESSGNVKPAEDDDWNVQAPAAAEVKPAEDDWNIEAPLTAKVKPADDDDWNAKAPPVDQPKKVLSITRPKAAGKVKMAKDDDWNVEAPPVDNPKKVLPVTRPKSSKKVKSAKDKDWNVEASVIAASPISVDPDEWQIEANNVPRMETAYNITVIAKDMMDGYDEPVAVVGNVKRKLRSSAHVNGPTVKKSKVKSDAMDDNW